MPVTMRNTDGSDLDLADEVQTAHSSAMWEGANNKGADLSSFRIPFSFGPSSAVPAERERCAKIAENPVGNAEWIETTGHDIKSFQAGYDMARRLIARKIREGA